MRYLRSFNESDSGWIDDLYEWIPEFYEFMSELSIMRDDADYTYSDLSNLLEIDDKGFKDPSNFIERCKHLVNTYDKPTIVKRREAINNIYKSWCILKKLDISVYPEIIDIVQDICDDNDLTFLFRSLSWMPTSSVYSTFFNLKFYLYDQSGEVSGINMQSNILLDGDRVSKIVSDIDKFDGKLKSLYCDIWDRSYNQGVVELSIRLFR